MPDDLDGDSPVLAQALSSSGRVLPPEALRDLRTAFTGEVAVRLPHLLALLDGPAGPDALRDAHSLGSSAVVVGECAAARTARALEVELAAASPDPDRTAALVRELAAQLAGWTGA